MDRKQQTKQIARYAVIKNVLMIAGVTFAFSTQVQAQSWTLTPESNVGFEIKSLGVTVVRAKFNRVQSSMQFDAKAPQYASTNFVMDVNSLSLSKPSLKNMILGEDLFYASKYKTANFKSTSFKDLGGGQYNIFGNLTLRGITKPVSFSTTLKPSASNANLLDVQSFAVINRSDFGMKKAMGGVGEKVNIQLSGQWKVQ
ncbi:YceI family protein [Acinetobacter johnsonii]|uniref:YceI family protein n=1 Tax=Acinetobacter TaxID=469 RepID=UPI0019B2B178|nr:MULTISPECIES: YceI family protein [Acinetobacter]MBC6674689.1 YceI family protein [Acinetobacter sp.]MDH1278656.1 YceI family protein [Acinetobacter johnsonii]MDH1698969.1 YceI family protein [Acinetobacter johnsonii]MDQ8974384.1 YceI family protein [Acinetobacter johnsonii]WEH95259.1 YceI family protein [Acinetobacter johnsonii]